MVFQKSKKVKIKFFNLIINQGSTLVFFINIEKYIFLINLHGINQ